MKQGYCLFASIVGGISCFLTSTRADQPDTLVICPVEFQSALRPWVEYRQGQGHQILVRAPAVTAEALRLQIQRAAVQSSLRHVVLIGDAADRNLPASRLVPTAYLAAQVNVLFGSEPQIATDHLYADLDGDGILELNIGRIPVDSAQQLSRYIERVIAYESADNIGNWQRRINLVAGGAGGFGKLTDMVIDQTVKRIITDLIPAHYDTSVTYGSWRSPYFPDPRRFSEMAICRFNEGCQFWVYFGHADRQRLSPVQLPDRFCEILDTKSAEMVSCESGFPIAIMLSCYCAAVDDADDGLGEVLLNQSRGPIAVIGSSRVSMPYAMSIFSLEMMDDYFHGRVATLGELITSAKRKLVEFDPQKSDYHNMLETVGRTFGPDTRLLADERREHVHLMHLLGDPLLRLSRPTSLEIRSPETAVAGNTMYITGHAPQSGELTLDLAYRRDRLRTRPKRRVTYNATHEMFATYQADYESAQQLIVASQTISVEAGRFATSLHVPTDCWGDCRLRGTLISNRTFAIGSNAIRILAE